MKNKGVLLLSLFLTISFVSALPILNFVDPTPANNQESTSDNFEINFTVTGVSNLQEYLFKRRS